MSVYWTTVLNVTYTQQISLLWAKHIPAHLTSLTFHLPRFYSIFSLYAYWPAFHFYLHHLIFSFHLYVCYVFIFIHHFIFFFHIFIILCFIMLLSQLFSCHFINKTIRDRFRRKTREQQIQSHTLSIMLTTTSPTDDRQMLLLLQSYGQRGTPNAFVCASKKAPHQLKRCSAQSTHIFWLVSSLIVVAYGSFENNHQRPANWD